MSETAYTDARTESKANLLRESFEILLPHDLEAHGAN